MGPIAGIDPTTGLLPGISFGQATDELGKALDNIQTSLANRIDTLAGQIDSLAATSSDADVADMSGVSDGSVVKLQYAINEMEKASESGTSTWKEAENLDKKLLQTLQG
jgi:hypothetical protein